MIWEFLKLNQSYLGGAGVVVFGQDVISKATPTILN